MSKQKEIAVFREIKVGEYVLRFWPSDNGWMCGITPEMMQALQEPQEKYTYGTPLLDAMTGKQPAPPPECQTDAEKTAFAFGWWKALEHVRQQPAQQALDKMAENAREIGLDYEPAQQQEPVAWRYLTQYKNQSVWTYCAFEPTSRETRQPLYTSPQPSKPWVGLTDEEVKHQWEVWRASIPRYAGFATGIEAKLREKNNG